MITAKNTGMETVKSLKSKWHSGSIIKIPTMIRAGEMAMDGIIKNTGEKNRVNRKQKPVTQAVSPVRPPTEIPVTLSAP